MRRFAVSNPCLIAGFTGALLFAIWVALELPADDGGIGQALYLAWRILAAPIHLAANVLAPLTDRWPDVLDGGAALLVGLLPYVIADALWRRRRRRSGVSFPARGARRVSKRGG